MDYIVQWSEDGDEIDVSKCLNFDYGTLAQQTNRVEEGWSRAFRPRAWVKHIIS